MKLSCKIPSCTIIIDKEYSEEEIYEMNKEKYIKADIQEALVKALFQKRRNFHLSIKSKGHEKVDWVKRLKELLDGRNQYITYFITKMNRSAKCQFMALEELDALEGNEEQKSEAIGVALDNGVYDVRYVKAVLKKIRDKTEREVKEVVKQKKTNQTLIQDFIDYE